MNDWKLLRFIDGHNVVQYRDIKRDFLKRELTLTPALDMEITMLLKNGLIKRNRNVDGIKDFDYIHMSAKGIRLCRLLKARDRIDESIKVVLSHK